MSLSALAIGLADPSMSALQPPPYLPSRAWLLPLYPFSTTPAPLQIREKSTRLSTLEFWEGTIWSRAVVRTSLLLVIRSLCACGQITPPFWSHRCTLRILQLYLLCGIQGWETRICEFSRAECMGPMTRELCKGGRGKGSNKTKP